MKVNIWYLKSHEIFTVAELKQKISTGENLRRECRSIKTGNSLRFATTSFLFTKKNR